MTAHSASFHLAEAACLRLSQFLPRVGLNADWCCDTWRLSSHIFLCQDEDASDLENFRVVMRDMTNPEDYGVDTGIHFHVSHGDVEVFVRNVLNFRASTALSLP